ncbi:neurofilament medium polypeptide-like isoform X2 [Euwallacea fornicatus]|uniref:neurofilament medium polypeptide-like isoform X2 n=1 Tax=Euwallacea fornicatus TaxID=995702 RepID=UPI00338F14BC
MEPRRCFGLLLVLGFTFTRIPALSQEYDDQGIWDRPEEHEQNFLSTLCENYDLYIYNEKIDCYAAQFVPKSPLWVIDDDLIIGHTILKRDVDDQVEGSGSLPESLPVEAPAQDESQIKGNETKEVAEEPSSDASEDERTKAEAEPQSADEEQLSNSETDAKELPVDEAAESTGVVPSGEVEDAQGQDEIAAPDTKEQPPDGGTGLQPEEDNVDPVEGQPQKIDPAAVSNSDNEAESAVVATGDDQVSKDVKESAVDEAAQVDNQGVPAAEAEKPAKEVRLSPFAVASLDTSNKEETAVTDKKIPLLEHETLKSETTLAPLINIAKSTTVAPKKESELLDNKQSGSAVLDKEPQVVNPSSVEGRDTEKHLSALSVSSSSNNQPSAGESAENVSNRGKDVTILVVLFVVVLVIGAAAFTHHFIKKRKQRTEEVKTLRNGDVDATKQPGDVEKGVEMKPLLNRNDKPVIIKEFSDTKKAVEA